jgi:hypothetical protein
LRFSQLRASAAQGGREGGGKQQVLPVGWQQIQQLADFGGKAKIQQRSASSSTSVLTADSRSALCCSKSSSGPVWPPRCRHRRAGPSFAG